MKRHIIEFYPHERWKRIPKYDNRLWEYSVSNYGRVMGYRIYDGKYYEVNTEHCGNRYTYVQLNCGTVSLARLVAEAFVPNPYNLPEVDHIDGNKWNNGYWNLMWCDHTGNMNNPITRARASEAAKIRHIRERILKLERRLEELEGRICLK